MTNDTPPQAEFVMVPREPTEAMHDAARDWSYKKYGKPIGTEASLGCWSAMLAAAPPQAIERSAGEGWAFDEDAGDITFGNAPVFKVYTADDFPCIEDEDRAKEDAWFKAQAQTAVLMLNSLFHDGGDQTPIPDPLASRSTMVERNETPTRAPSSFSDVAPTMVEREAMEAAIHAALVRWSNGDQPQPLKAMIADAILAEIATAVIGEAYCDGDLCEQFGCEEHNVAIIALLANPVIGEGGK